MLEHQYFQLLFYIVQFSHLIMIVLFAVATWRLRQSRAMGSRWMLWGMMTQGMTLLGYVYRSIRPQLLAELGFTKINYPPIEFITYLVGSLGLVIFAVGLVLHANQQRGLQTRVDELERILDDVQQRER